MQQVSFFSVFFWSAYAHAYDRLLGLTPYRQYLADIHEYISPTATNILELGCGTGNIWATADPSLTEGVRIILLDSSPTMLDRTKGKLKSMKNMAMIQADMASRLPFEDRSLDQVIMANTLYTCQKPENVLAEVFRVLRPQGYLLISNPRSTFSMARILQAHAKESDHPRWSVPNKFWPLSKLFFLLSWSDRFIRKNLPAFLFILAVNVHIRNTGAYFPECSELASLLERNGFKIWLRDQSYANQNILIMAQKKGE